MIFVLEIFSWLSLVRQNENREKISSSTFPFLTIRIPEKNNVD